MAIVFNLLRTFLLVELLVCGARLRVSALRVDYYAETCPFAEMIVRGVVDEALRNNPTLSAGLLRMHFHDCFIEGCDGSVLIDSTRENTAEKDSPANLSLRGFEVIDQAKEELEQQCEGLVSCADIVAIAARDAVYWAGGPYYDVPLGRKDGLRSKIEDTIRLPPPTLNTTGLIGIFYSRGFTVEDMVALSGGHTLGAARCANFKDRLRSNDPTLDPFLANTLSRICRGGNNAAAALDWTPASFDNRYFQRLRAGGGVLASDQTLYSDPRTRGMVNAYAMDQDHFFRDFANAMWKMGMLDVKEGVKGNVRLNCRRFN